jgi:hypothetical protein
VPTDLRLGVLAERHDAPDVVSPRIACKNGEDHAEEDVVQPQQNQHLTGRVGYRFDVLTVPALTCGFSLGAARAAYGLAPCWAHYQRFRFEACRCCEGPQAGTSAALHEEHPRGIRVVSAWYPRGAADGRTIYSTHTLS